MINHISKEDAQKLYNSASTHVPAGTVNSIVNNIQQPKKNNFTNFTKIIASQKGKGSK